MVEIGRTLLTGAVTASRVAVSAITGVTGTTVQAVLANLKTQVDQKAAKNNTTAGTYTLSTVTVNGEGIVTSLSSGSPGAVSDASTTTKGASKASVAPASSTDPIFTGTNDPRVTADQAAGTASIRTLGTGAVQAAAGNHAHTKYDHFEFFYSGDVAAKTGVGHDPATIAGTIDGIWVTADAAPAGGTVTATVVKEAGGPGGTGTTVGAVTLAISSKGGSTTGLSVAIAQGDSVRLDVSTGSGYTAASCKNLVAKARTSY